ncbi:MAG TPA: hypothetical protein VFG39_07435 [Balneolaceae bacterium]|nr:hypothetical protein [Balneolaceae bacterium]
MFKRVVSILVLLSVLATIVRFTLPFVWYYSNYEYISQELCVNRHNPEMECNGSCQLEKMIKKKHHHNEEDAVPAAVQEFRINLFFSEALDTSPILASLSSSPYSYAGTFETLWFEEPLSPPPQIASSAG